MFYCLNVYIAQDMASSSMDSIDSSTSFLRGGENNSNSLVDVEGGESNSSEMSSYYAVEWKPRHAQTRTRRWMDSYKAISNTYANINHTIKRNENTLHQSKSKIMNQQTNSSSSAASLVLSNSQSLSQLPSLYNVHTSGSLASRSSVSGGGESGRRLKSLKNGNESYNDNNSNSSQRRAVSSSASLSALHRNQRANETNTDDNRLSLLDKSNSSPVPLVSEQAVAISATTKTTVKEIKDIDKEAVNEIITLRAKKEEMIEFLEHCAYTINRQVTATGQAGAGGGWRKFAKIHESDM